jgi:hypothetical protein
MNRTLAVMFTMTTYGTWLRGDQRNWVDDGVIMPPNPILEKNDAQRMEYAPFRFVDDDWWAIGNWIGTSLIDRMKLRIAAMTVQPWHVHFVVAATERAISDIAKCAKDAVRWGLRIKRRIGPMATTNDFASTRNPSKQDSFTLRDTTPSVGVRQSRGVSSKLGDEVALTEALHPRDTARATPLSERNADRL